jgi:hypothetical protein
VVDALAVDYYEPHQEAPFWLDVARIGADTLALFTTQSHDIQDAYTLTKAYKVNLASGSISPYPLYLMADGEHSSIESSVRIGGDDDSEQSPAAGASAASPAASESGSGPPAEEQASANADANKTAGAAGPPGPLGPGFDNVRVNICPEGDRKCPPLIVHTFNWNGKAYVIEHYDEARREFLRRLSAHRECLKLKFDPKNGSADCASESGDYYDYDDNCESNNDLSYLNFKAGSLDRARDYAGKALEECKDNPKELAAAQFNERRSRNRQ